MMLLLLLMTIMIMTIKPVFRKQTQLRLSLNSNCGRTMLRATAPPP
jgi:hypothetical protein